MIAILLIRQPPTRGQHSSMRQLEQLASLLARRDAIDKKIVDLIGRPALKGHVGEWIAQEIFGVKLAESAASEGLRRPVCRRSADRQEGEREVARQA